MPNYDGTGPLKRGRVVGRGMGPCHRSPDSCIRKEEQPDCPAKDRVETPPRE
ncbi:DUF5320 domain-containing protein [Methanoregula sp.]|uniref:DUF5320 domain-containing protein n=1 Tax=Methanoregula sp. TaxID=2052170 RepID=UPI002A3936CE|nr:DUF5320 domain-containing protein [Methanoregula sp.]